jgi:hypothetical protein
MTCQNVVTARSHQVVAPGIVGIIRSPDRATILPDLYER